MYQTWQFGTDGKVLIHAVENAMYAGGRESWSERWSTSGDMLYFGSPHPAWVESISMWCLSTWDFTPVPRQSAYRIIWLDDGRIRLDEVDVDLMYVILSRIPE